MIEEPGTPGPSNDITDVPGVLVGHHQRVESGWATGATAVLAPDGAVGGVDSRGGAPGTRETDLLDPVNMVQRVHGVSLAGGSAFGLAAADGVMRWLSAQGFGFPAGQHAGEVVPIVPAAVLYDLPLNTWGNRPDAEFGNVACTAAAARAGGRGCLGAGAGATVGRLKGGVGTASEVLPSGPVLGALVVVNAAGTAVDPASGLPWALADELGEEFGLRTPNSAERDAGARVLAGESGQLNTTIGVVGTDAALSKAECQRLAMSGQDGLARAVRPAHTMFDGDTLFALATGRREIAAAAGPFGPAGRAVEVDRLAAAAARAVARAIVHGLLAARGVAGVPAYAETYPSAV